jgi:4-amino-4-deoxy-L-arabinose transferase-like glycosyltransferase
MRAIKTPFIISLLTLAGFAFRIFLAYWVPQTLIYDQYQYYGYAASMLAHGLTGDTVRLYGYPLIILPSVKYFGAASPLPWIIFHAVLDTLTALMVFAVARKIFTDRDKSAAWISFIIYLFNPYTSAFVNVLLTEITAIFQVTLAIWLIMTFLYRHKAGSLLLAAFVLGFIPQVRPSFFYWSVVMTGFILWLTVKARAKLKLKIATGISIILMFFLPFSYTVVSNLVLYHQFALQSVDNIFWREVYISNYIGRGIPFAGNPDWMWPPQAYEAWYEFSSPTTPAGRSAMARKYEDKSISIIRADPAKFITHHAYKLWYVWEKHFLYPYQIGPDSPLIRFAVYWGNVGLLLSGWAGAILFILRKKIQADRNRLMIGLTSVVLFIYISVAHVFSTSEERFSLPAYPMIAVFAGYTVVRIKNFIANFAGNKKGSEIKAN